MSDLRARMAATANPKPAALDTTAWGRIWVRPVMVAELEGQADEPNSWKSKRHIARGAARVICNEDGTPVFDPDNEQDVELIAAQPWALLKQVTDAAAAFNATSPQGSDAAKNG